jgi:glutamate--cysteine ligase
VPAHPEQLTLDDARRRIASAGFDAPVDVTSDEVSPDAVGLELEWHVVRATDPAAPVQFDAVRSAAVDDGALPNGSRITFEPGGQVELSALPRDTVDAAIALAAEDAAELLARLARAGLRAIAIGLDPARPREVVLDDPRYHAMADYFSRQGSAGASMMCATASLQINVGLGRGEQRASRWQLAHDLGPVIAAAFAHSPLCGSQPSGWRSTRLAVWLALDPSRTEPVAVHPGSDPRTAWADYALGAQVMFVRRSAARFDVPSEPLTFAEWIERGHPLGTPTLADLEYHLTTLFPPVRPRGWLELRILDALPDPLWRIASAVTASLIVDDDASRAIAPALHATRGRWVDAALQGVRDRALRDAALACFDVALESMHGGSIDRAVEDATRDYRDRYLAKGQTPADDRLDDWSATGALVPDPEPIPATSWI